MSDYCLRGGKRLVNYRNSLNVPVTNEQMAAAIGVPIIVFAGGGRDGSSYISAKYPEAKAQALAGLLGVTVANVTTNGGQEIVG
jgi:hypothetical protein